MKMPVILLIPEPGSTLLSLGLARHGQSGPSICLLVQLKSESLQNPTLWDELEFPWVEIQEWGC